MEPFGIIAIVGFVVSMTAFWTNDYNVSKKVVQSEERFVVDDTVYRCEAVQNIYDDPAPRIVRVPTYIDKPCPTCPKPVKRPLKPKPVECK